MSGERQQLEAATATARAHEERAKEERAAEESAAAS